MMSSSHSQGEYEHAVFPSVDFFFYIAFNIALLLCACACAYGCTCAQQQILNNTEAKVPHTIRIFFLHVFSKVLMRFAIPIPISYNFERRDMQFSFCESMVG